MTRVYLVRHAKAEEHAAGGDAARRLSPEGRARFAALLQRVTGRLQLTRILTSPLVRARETAELLAAATGAPVETETALASGASDGRALLELLREAGPGVAAVGHNPEVAEALALAGAHLEKVKPGAIAAIDLGPRAPAVAWVEMPDKR